VVVKFMAADLVSSPGAVERFSREAAAAAQVKSPHVVQMLDHGLTPQGVPFIAMELLEGEDLGKRLHVRRRLSITETADIVGQVCKALSRAHERGIVHRDVKPDNIFLCAGADSETFVKLLDFGIAKGDAQLGTSNGTATGAMIGTPVYMAPEQILMAKDLDYRADLWALGVVAYECIVGTKPFMESSLGALLIQIHSGTMPVPSSLDPSLPPAFDAWFAKACARDRQARFGSAKDLGNALVQISASVGQVEPVPGAVPVASRIAASTTPLRRSDVVSCAAVQPAPRSLTVTAGVAELSSGSSPGSRGESDLHGGVGTHSGFGQATIAPRSRGNAGRWIVALAASLVVLAVAGVWSTRHGGSNSPAPSAATSMAPPPSNVPSPQVSVLMPALAPSIAAEIAPPSESSTASAPAEPAPPPAARPNRAKSPAAGLNAAPAAAPSGTSNKPAADCNTPYFFDARGNRVFKPECL
jgi:serine/threonine-protein kinase